MNPMYSGICTAISQWRWDFSTFWVKSLRADISVLIEGGDLLFFDIIAFAENYTACF
jgi:hypothetical protein